MNFLDIDFGLYKEEFIPTDHIYLFIMIFLWLVWMGCIPVCSAAEISGIAYSSTFGWLGNSTGILFNHKINYRPCDSMSNWGKKSINMPNDFATSKFNSLKYEDYETQQKFNIPFCALRGAFERTSSHHCNASCGSVDLKRYGWVWTAYTYGQPPYYLHRFTQLC